MPQSLQDARRLTISEAEDAVKKIKAKEETAFYLVSFMKYKRSHQGSTLKSKQYEKYLVLCHANSLYHAGWIVCPYILTGFCVMSKGLYEINTRKGGTNKFGQHMTLHERCTSGEVHMERDLNPRCKEEISDAAALAVVLDLRPMGFTENREGMAAYAKAVFSAGQSVPVGIPINAKSYLPSRTAIKSSLDRLEVKLCAIFSKELRTNLLSQGGAVSVDGVTLKLQGKQYYDFTIHHISM